ncbi:MAG: hypothetical protein IJE71_11360 [Clostridia bacterium]|nr:hypothetical protein [Clostridia bacterium]
MAKRRRQQAGDTQMAERKGSVQPLSVQERELTARAYALYDHFREQLSAEHEAMREARRMRQMKQEGAFAEAGLSPTTNTLGSCVDNVVADQIDNMPEAVMIPEREETMRRAEEMTDVVGYVLHHAGFAGKYQRIMEDAVVTGTGIAQVFWDAEASDGEGLVNILSWHPEDFYPDPMYEEIQDGRGCFKATHTTVSWVEERYPHAQGYVMGDEPMREDAPADGYLTMAPDGDAKVALLEFWYKRYNAETGAEAVHMAQLAGGALLLSTETGVGLEDGPFSDGVYAHGQYPFVLFRYRDVWRRPFGSGLIHDYRPSQRAIDRYCKYIDDNARESSVQRHFIRRGSGVNAEDVADMRRTVIEWDGSDIREVLQTVQTQPINGQVYQMMQYLADAMKQDCGQNQFARGEGGMNVTAGTAINALQQAGSKIARWHTERFKEAFREMVMQVMWVLHEYMEPGRVLWIAGMDGAGERMIEMIREGEGFSRPAYTVRVQVQRSNPDQIARDNEFLLQAAQICAQAGTPLPAETIIRLMEGQRIKESVLRAIGEGHSPAMGQAQAAGQAQNL